MVIKTIFNYGDEVKEKYTNYRGKVLGIESMITGIDNIDKASQSYLVVKDISGIKERHWIRAERLERVEE